MNKYSVFFRFVLVLQDLLSSNIKIQEALELIIKSKRINKDVRKAAQYVLQEMSSGEFFSSSVSKNPYLTVPSKYITLFYSEEKTGSIRNTLNFVVANEQNKKEISGHIIQSAVYPLLILCVSIFGTLLLYRFRSSFFPDSSQVFMSGIAVSLCFIFTCISLFGFLTYQIFKDTDTYVFLLILGFFLESGFDTFTSMLSTAMQFYSGSKTRTSILQCVEQLSSGMKLGEAIESLSFLDNNSLLKTDFLQDTGTIVTLVKNEFLREKKRQEQKRAVFLSLCEPVMIMCIGIYLLLLIQWTVLPMMISFGGLL